MDMFCGVCNGLIPVFPIRGLVFCNRCRTDFHRDCISLKKTRIFGYRQRDINCPICDRRSNSKIRRSYHDVDEQDECGAIYQPGHSSYEGDDDDDDG